MSIPNDIIEELYAKYQEVKSFHKLQELFGYDRKLISKAFKDKGYKVILRYDEDTIKKVILEMELQDDSLTMFMEMPKYI